MNGVRNLLRLGAALVLLGGGMTAEVAAEDRNAREQRARPNDDTSGRVQQGRASYYHPSLDGRPMANGEPFDKDSNSAASRTLPLGTTARVTNLENGRSTEVEIEDRGPYVGGRIIDLSPGTARELGMTQQGVARVEVAPIEVPQRDGSRRPGAGAEETGDNVRDRQSGGGGR